ncbi:hypothetical protein T492DRAFT_979197 [Pavlovales sp. CCMP2436]|nr:hypothetical protein T492DRAFT_979197 [Pavlovales sp. CCMP2436]
MAAGTGKDGSLDDDALDAEAARRRLDAEALEQQFASFKTGGRKFESKLFGLPGVRSLFLLGQSLAVSSKVVAGNVVSLSSVAPAYQQLLLLNVLIYIAQSSFLPTLLIACARINRLVLCNDQVHRLITPIFLHADVRHLLFNSISLFNLGPTVERIYGTKRFLLLYLASGLVGNLVGLEYGPPNPSVGASGCIFGLVGAMLVFVRRTQEMRLDLGKQITTSLFFTVVFGLLPRRGVDQWAHVGGLLGGLVCSALFAPWRWGETRTTYTRDTAQDRLNPYVREDRPLVPSWGVDAAFALIGVTVAMACWYGFDYALRLFCSVTSVGPGSPAACARHLFT